MAASYLPYRPDQSYLLPPSLGEWLPEGHLAYFISETVDTLDLSAFHARYAGGGPGNQPFHPAMMVKVLIYGYASGVFSSRKLARKLYEDVALRVLAAGNFPAHRTLSDFRALHLTELENLFVQVVQLARECGLVKLGTIAVDGTKVKANASRHKAMSYKRMKPAEDELHCEIKALLDRAKATDDQSVTSRSWTFLPRFLAARSAWRRSRRQRRAWKRASVKRTRPGGAAKTMAAGLAIRMARTRAVARTNASLVCRMTVIRKASPIRTAGS